MPRKVFVAGEILTAADVNTNLMDQAVMVFDDDTARGSAIPSPTEGMVTYLKDVNQVQAYDGSAFTPVGTILQVVSTTKTDTFSTSSSSLTDVTGLSATITPSSTANKIFAMLTIGSVDGDGIREIGGDVTRAGTPIGIGDASGSRGRAGWGIILAGANRTQSAAWSFLDSPSSTSALTYQARIRTGAGTLYLNQPQVNTDSSARNLTVSSITLYEVAG